MRPLSQTLLIVLALLLTRPAFAGRVEGRVFLDVDGDGVQGPEEQGLPSLPVLLWQDGGQFEATSGPDGAFAVDAGTAQHFVEVAPPLAHRLSLPDQTSCPPDESPAGLRRYGSAQQLRMNVESLGPGGALSYVSLGDSIAAGVSFCIFQDTEYAPEVAQAIADATGADVVLDNRAVGGYHSEDLLAPFLPGRLDNDQFVGNVIEDAPDLVTLSIGGNDFLDSEPSRQSRPFDPGELERSFLELIATRQSAQEALSALATELPFTDLEINSVYDNLAPACATTDFHAAATPIWNQMLRMLAFGQVRTVHVGEAALDFAHVSVDGASCCGLRDKICTLDDIHPNSEGAEIIGEAVLESFGHVRVADAATTSGVDVGLQRRVARLFPSRVEVFGGDVTAEEEAVSLDGVGALVRAARVDPTTVESAWVELSGFELPDGVDPRALVVGVRYRTDGAFENDVHRFEASVVDFAPPELTFTGWDTVTPLVGASGLPGEGTGGASVTNVLSDLIEFREVTAAITFNAIDDGTVTGFYTWPAPSAADVERLRVRLAVDPAGGADDPDAAAIEWDGAWLDVYGLGDAVLPDPPPEVADVRSGDGPLTVGLDGASLVLSWSETPRTDAYRVHVGALPDTAGDPTPWSEATAGPDGCTSTTTWTGPADGSLFLLVSAVGPGGDGPLGQGSEGTNRTAAPPACP